MTPSVYANHIIIYRIQDWISYFPLDRPIFQDLFVESDCKAVMEDLPSRGKI